MEPKNQTPKSLRRIQMSLLSDYHLGSKGCDRLRGMEEHSFLKPIKGVLLSLLEPNHRTTYSFDLDIAMLRMSRDMRELLYGYTWDLTPLDIKPTGGMIGLSQTVDPTP